LWLAAGVALSALAVRELRPPVVAVDTAIVASGSVCVTVEEEGETRLQRRFLVSSPVAGQVSRIDARPGDRVERGRTVLAVIAPAHSFLLDPRAHAAAKARLRTADAVVSKAGAEHQEVSDSLAQAAADAARIKALFETGYASQQEFESAQARWRTLGDRLRAAEHAKRAAEFERDEAAAALQPPAAAAGPAVKVVAPVDGVVVRRLHESEASVLAGAPLIEIGDLRDLEIVADLLSADAVKVRAGASVAISRWGGDHDLRGEVRRVEPSGFMKISALGVEEQRVNVLIDFIDPPAVRAALGDGFRVEVRIDVAESSNVVKTPVSALFRRDGRWFVFVVDQGRVRLRSVEVGQRSDSEAEIRRGLAPGNEVVIYPAESLKDGQRVKVSSRAAFPSDDETGG
jgi:HlyD family secretion protein